MKLELSTLEVLSAAELQHYAAERRRDRGLLGRRRGALACLVIIAALIAAVSLLEGGHTVASFSLTALILVIEGVFVFRHRTKPERQPIVDTIEGLVEFVSAEDEEDSRFTEAMHARWFVGQQRLHVPPHWQRHMVHGERTRLRLARPPGESLAFVLGIDGRASADFERAQGLPPAPDAQPVLVLVVVTTGLLTVVGLLIGALQFSLGDSSLGDGFSTLSATIAKEQTGTLADIERIGLSHRGAVKIQDATVLPSEWIIDPPAGAARAVLSTSGRDRLTAMLETKHGREIGEIPTPGETSEPVSLQPADVLVWQRADLHETRSPTGRPGDQVLVWLGRRRPLEFIRTDSDPVGPSLARAREQAGNLAFATGCVLLGTSATPLFLLTIFAVARARRSRAQFRARAERAYAVT